MSLLSRITAFVDDIIIDNKENIVTTFNEIKSRLETANLHINLDKSELIDNAARAGIENPGWRRFRYLGYSTTEGIQQNAENGCSNRLPTSHGKTKTLVSQNIGSDTT